MSKLTNREVGHAWYYNQQSNTGDVGAENFFYNGDTIYSYGSHYPIAKKYDNFVLFTVDGSGFHDSSSYGQTTACHVSLTRQAIPSNQQVIFVEVPSATSKQDHKYNYEREIKRIEGLLKFIARGRAGTNAQDWRLEQLELIVAGMNIYTKAFKLGKRQLTVGQFLAPGALDKIKTGEKKRLAKKKRDDKARQERIATENKAAIEGWKAGETYYVPYYIDKVFLRVSGEHIETSKGAKILIKHARILFAYILDCCKGEREFKQRHFGDFHLLSIDKDCNIQIGCHYIEFKEMSRINELLPTQ